MINAHVMEDVNRVRAVFVIFVRVWRQLWPPLLERRDLHLSPSLLPAWFHHCSSSLCYILCAAFATDWSYELDRARVASDPFDFTTPSGYCRALKPPCTGLKARLFLFRFISVLLISQRFSGPPSKIQHSHYPGTVLHKILGVSLVVFINFHQYIHIYEPEQ